MMQKKGNRRKYPISLLFPLESSLKFIISSKTMKKSTKIKFQKFFIVSNLKALTAECISSKIRNEYKSTKKRYDEVGKKFISVIIVAL